MIRLRQVIGLGLIALLFGCNNTNEEKVFFDKLDLKTMDGKALTVAELEEKWPL